MNYRYSIVFRISKMYSSGKFDHFRRRGNYIRNHNITTRNTDCTFELLADKNRLLPADGIFLELIVSGFSLSPSHQN